MKQLHFFSAATVNWVFMLKFICMSMKHYKNPDYSYVYHIMLDTDNLDKYNNFKYLETDTFKIDLMSFKLIESKLSTERLRERMKMAYVKCLVSYLFPHLDKILCLDTDLLITNSGIEKIFEEDISNVYVAAGYDIPLQLKTNSSEKINCKVQFYFNTGVFLLNLKKIREDGIDKLLEQDCLHWPEGVKNNLFDQTLYNYRCKQKVLWLHPIFNNMLFGTVKQNIKYYQFFFKQIKWYNVKESLDHSIISHFTNSPKPWVPSKINNLDEKLPFRKKAQQILLMYMKLLNE